MNRSGTQLFRAKEYMAMYAGDFFLLCEKDWYWWAFDKWMLFDYWERPVGGMRCMEDLQPSNPLEFLTITGKHFESQLV
jgi:hypothetical protein